MYITYMHDIFLVIKSSEIIEDEFQNGNEQDVAIGDCNLDDLEHENGDCSLDDLDQHRQTLRRKLR